MSSNKAYGNELRAKLAKVNRQLAARAAVEDKDDFEGCVAALAAIAGDPKAPYEERTAAEGALTAIKRDTSAIPEVRATAEKALARVTAKKELSRRMQVPNAFEEPLVQRHRNVQTFHASGTVEGRGGKR